MEHIYILSAIISILGIIGLFVLLLSPNTCQRLYDIGYKSKTVLHSLVNIIKNCTLLSLITVFSVIPINNVNAQDKNLITLIYLLIALICFAIAIFYLLKLVTKLSGVIKKQGNIQSVQQRKQER